MVADTSNAVGIRIGYTKPDSSIATRIASNLGGYCLNQFLYTLYSTTTKGIRYPLVYRLHNDHSE